MLKIDQPILVDNILPSNENKNLLNILATKHYYIASDDYSNAYLTAYDNKTPHVGFCFCLYDEIDERFKKFNLNDPLSIYVRIITSIILDKTKFTNPKSFSRIHCNYYLKNQKGILHKDREEDNFLSIVYTPLETDGGTMINDIFYKDVMGQAKVFKSNWNHKGVSCKENKARSSINIILKY
jgi:hypothetical protein